MKVIATARGYFEQIREPGDEFDMPEDLMKKKDGKTVLPSWVAAPESDPAPNPKKGGKASKEEDLV